MSKIKAENKKQKKKGNKEEDITGGNTAVSKI